MLISLPILPPALAPSFTLVVGLVLCSRVELSEPIALALLQVLQAVEVDFAGEGRARDHGLERVPADVSSR